MLLQYMAYRPSSCLSLLLSAPNLVLILSFLVVTQPNQGLQVPLGSQCDHQSMRETRGLNRTSDHDSIDKLVNVTANSAVVLFSTQPRYPVNQKSFESVCFGWRNNINRNQARNPVALWVYDEGRSILVAKFIYYSRNEYYDVSQQTAWLISPIFRLNLSQTQSSASRDRRVCSLKFSSYSTLSAHLDVNLILLTNSSGAVKVKQRRLLKELISRSIIAKPRQDFRDFETSLWKEYNVKLDFVSNLNSSDDMYAFEFSVSVGRVTSETTQLVPKHLNGLALANITLTPECFGYSSTEQTNDDSLATKQDHVLLWNSISNGKAKEKHPNSELRTSIESSNENRNMTNLFMYAFIFIVFSIIIIQLILFALYDSPVVNSWLSRNPDGMSVKLFKHIFCMWRLERNCGQVYECRDALDKSSSKISSANGSIHMNLVDMDRIGVNQLNKSTIKHSKNDLQLIELTTYLDELNQGPESPKPRDLLQINPKQLVFSKLLGKGAFGSVYQGELIVTGQSGGLNQTVSYINLQEKSKDVAIKMLSEKRTNGTDNLREFIDEALNLARVSHRNIVGLVGVCFEEKPFYIVMELMSGGSLKRFLLQAQTDESIDVCMGDLLVFGLDIARACNYISQRNLIHRDLAARNCLLTATKANRATRSAAPDVVETNNKLYTKSADETIDLDRVHLNGYANSGIVVKLADFGMTRHLVDESNYYLMNVNKEVPVRWMAPECANYRTVPKSDVWAFGIVLWEIFSLGQIPYSDIKDNNAVLRYLRSLNNPEEQRYNIGDSSSDYLNSRNCYLEPGANLVNNSNYQGLSNNHREAPLQPPQPNTPESIYSIMCDCWSPTPQNRPDFFDIATRICQCLDDPKALKVLIRDHSTT